MEYDGETRPYSVLTRDDLKEKMKKQIHDLSEIFWLSESDATVLLMHLRWDSLRASERLGEDKEKLLMASGLIIKPLDSSSKAVSNTIGDDECYEFVDSNNPSCRICFKTCDDEIDDDELISTPLCSHKFCSSCFREYLAKSVYSLERNQTVISCPDPVCGAAVGPETIEKLPIRDREMYESYILTSYLEENKVLMIKLCPAPGCNYAIEFHGDENDDEYSLNVVCLCGFTFCWRCKIESHRPVTCNNALDWFSTHLNNLEEEANEALRLACVHPKTKRCPNCLSFVDMRGGKHRRFLTCGCSLCFCSNCLRPKEVHKTRLGFFGLCVEPERQWEEDKPEVSCLDSWKASEISVEEAKTDLHDFDHHIIKKQSIFKEEDIRMVREGLMLIVQCRQVLKWTCVYGYFHTEYEVSKKEYLRFLQENATTTLDGYLKTLLEETEEAFSASICAELSSFRHKLSAATTNIGNYFYHLIKTLQDGIADVKVKSYDNVAGPYWFCDRCTYGNTWLHKECKMCCDATLTSPQDLSD